MYGLFLILAIIGIILWTLTWAVCRVSGIEIDTDAMGEGCLTCLAWLVILGVLFGILALVMSARGL